ncbi:hypothetical protein GON03_20495 [Nocardioides sp. MAH-18]|uniref:DUF3618 domain-containing protein n=1 Tax=Nocardioides agri TaxID=2682843 RepID=A0A6L6Y1V3_9ACTN|nr:MULTISPECIES: hypothetical protein [unclassified Nocardioides]MBA2952403.1 hypothetical protein [Nocardioides sp. CGMCC 1.13656]MVQ51565.1 hypothetical protein [Nocardioides sp. MAH-18]
MTTTDQGATTRSGGTASTAVDEGKHVGAVAKDEIRAVAGTAAEQARSVAGDTVNQLRDQLAEQTGGQRDRLVSTLQSFGDDLERMATQAGEGGLAADLARETAARARALREHLDGREPGQLLDDVRDFARRRPGTFLVGALVAGVAAGRLFRGAADGAAAAELAEPTPPVRTELPPTGPAAAGSARPLSSGPGPAPSSHGQTTIEPR